MTDLKDTGLYLVGKKGRRVLLFCWMVFKVIIETVKIERKEIGIAQVKEMLDNGATIKAALVETGITDQDNYPVKEYAAVIKRKQDGEETTIIMNILDVLKLVELYIGEKQ
jgi:hypothetical protein